MLSSVKADPVRNALPKELSVLVNDLASDAPSHMLAVYSRQPSTSARRRVTLFPTHNIVLAVYCANLPHLPPSEAPTPSKPGCPITIPVVPLCLPSPETFPQLSSFLYTKQTSHLLASLLPCPAPSIDPTAYTSNDPTLLQFTKKLAGTYTTQALLQHAMTVNGLWRNVCALGVDDIDLWSTMDLAWELLLTAMAIGTGNPQAMITMQGP